MELENDLPISKELLTGLIEHLLNCPQRDTMAADLLRAYNAEVTKRNEVQVKKKEKPKKENG